MKRKIKLTKLYGNLGLYLLKNTGLRNKLKYFLQVNNLYIADDDGNVTLSSVVEYWKEINNFGDQVLTVRFLRTSSIIDLKLEDIGGRLEALFGCEILEQVNTVDFIGFIFLIKELEREEYYLENLNIPVNDFVYLNKYNVWNYRKNPNLLISGMPGSGKSMLLYFMIKQLPPDNVYICDGKLDELKRKSEDFGIEKNAKSYDEIIKIVNDFFYLMEKRYKLNSEKNKPAFLVIDELAALKLVYKKKEREDLNNKIKALILKGRAANCHLVIVLQKPLASSIDSDIRDNIAVKVGLGNLTNSTFQVTFGFDKSDKIHDRKEGEGYISVNGEDVKLLKLPRIYD